MEEEFSRLGGIMIKGTCLCIGGDIDIMEKDLSIFDLSIAVFELDPAGSNRFDFCAGENHAGLIGCQDLEIMTSLFVLNYYF